MDDFHSKSRMAYKQTLRLDGHLDDFRKETIDYD